MHRQIVIICFFAISFIGVRGQNTAIKTNLLYDLIGVASLGVETKMSNKSTISLMATYNPLKYGNAKWKNYSFQPEYRHWFRQAFKGAYISVNACGGGFNIDNVHIGGLHGKQRQGYFFGAGIGGGYNLMISSRCSFDFSIAIEYLRCRYDRYRYGEMPYYEGRLTSNILFPLGTGIAFTYNL